MNSHKMLVTSIFFYICLRAEEKSRPLKNLNQEIGSSNIRIRACYKRGSKEASAPRRWLDRGENPTLQEQVWYMIKKSSSILVFLINTDFINSWLFNMRTKVPYNVQNLELCFYPNTWTSLASGDRLICCTVVMWSGDELTHNHSE